MDELNIINSELYEGNEPYIFISCSYRDRERAIPVLNAMNQAGYRIWYGHETRPDVRTVRVCYESAAKHILNCRVFMPLLSQAFIQSENCLDEIFYARAEKKLILPLYLENILFPDELKWIRSLKRIHDPFHYESMVLSENLQGLILGMGCEPQLLFCNNESQRIACSRPAASALAMHRIVG